MPYNTNSAIVCDTTNATPEKNAPKKNGNKKAISIGEITKSMMPEISNRELQVGQISSLWPAKRASSVLTCDLQTGHFIVVTRENNTKSLR
jgi:hypothetical protein